MNQIKNFGYVQVWRKVIGKCALVFPFLMRERAWYFPSFSFFLSHSLFFQFNSMPLFLSFCMIDNGGIGTLA